MAYGGKRDAKVGERKKYGCWPWLRKKPVAEPGT